MPRKIFILAVLLFTALGLISAGNREDGARETEAIQSYYRAGLDTLYAHLLSWKGAIERREGGSAMLRHYRAGRYAYKRIEALVEYFYPSAALAINGPALPEAEAAEPQETLYPSGFQVLEPLVFAEDSPPHADLLRELNTVLLPVERLRRAQTTFTSTPAEAYHAVRLNHYRLAAKGLAGFDTPVGGTAIEEIWPTLQSSQILLRLLGAEDTTLAVFDAAWRYAETAAGAGFNAFDRGEFYVRYLKPVQEATHRFGAERGFLKSSNPLAIRTDAEHLFAAGAADPLAFAPAGTQAPTAEVIRLGAALFREPALSVDGSRACTGCHDPALAFTDGKAKNQTLGGTGTLLRNTPTLINAAYSPVQFWDSRIAFLEDQVHAVVSNREEMGGDFAQIVQRLGRRRDYGRMFAAAWPADRNPVSERHLKEALAAYVRSLSGLDAPFDRYMRGERSAMTAAQVRGFNLFMGKAKCGTCHFLPFFNGAVPPLFEKGESEVLGVPSTPDTANAVIDADLGKYALYRMEHHRHSFKTPTVRNAALTAPYMHNGVFRALEEVVDFYDRGGGAGLGFDLPNQTLPPERLGLTAEEKADLIQFMHALTDVP